MPQIDNHLKWCMKDEKRLVKTEPDLHLARGHLAKSGYNYNVLLLLEKNQVYDWALNVGFYSIYHCFLAILSKYGYSSRNQSCTVTALLKLIEEKKLDFDKDLILQFDVLEADKNAELPTFRESREVSTYGIKTSIDLGELKKIKEMAIKIQRETIRVLQQ